MQRTTLRDEQQAWAVAEIINRKKGVIVLPTGYGKTRIGINLAKAIIELGKTRILIVTSRTTLVAQWKELIGGKAEVCCIHTAYKIIGDYDLLIVDEAHRSLSPEFRKLYENVTSEYLLLLTATVPHKGEYREFMETIAPIVMTKDLAEALHDDAISDFEVYNVALKSDKLSGSKYKLFNLKLKENSIKLMELRRKYNLKATTPFDMARENLNSDKEDLKKAAKGFWSAMMMRKQSLYENGEKIQAVLKIVGALDKRWIIFFKGINEAVKCSKLLPNSAVYHSKMSNKARIKVLEDVKSGKVRILIGVDALNEGLDIPALDAGICVSGDSSTLVFIQSMGRVLRKQAGKKALFINLYTQDTREETWIKEKTKGVPTLWVKTLAELLGYLN